MHSTRFALALSLAAVSIATVLAVGCTDSHLGSSFDAGSAGDAARADEDAGSDTDAASSGDAGHDAAAIDGGPTRICRLGEVPGGVPGSAGEGCFCDGPFAMRGDVAYRLSFMLEAIDLSDPDRPRLASSVLHTSSYGNDVVIVDDVLFAAGREVERFDLAAPLAPVSLGVIDVGGESVALAHDGNRILAAIQGDGGRGSLVEIDATDPRAPLLGVRIDLGEVQVTALALAGDRAFAVVMEHGSGVISLVSVDVAGDRVMGSIVLEHGSTLGAIAIRGDYVFVSQLSEGVHAFDVHDPSTLVDLGRVATEVETPFALTITGDRLVVLGGGAWLYDIADPSALVLAGHVDWASDLAHAELLGETHLIVSGGNQLVSLPLVCE